MSYRLISSNDIAIKYPEVNDMPCIYADLPNGMDGEHYVLKQEQSGDLISRDAVIEIVEREQNKGDALSEIEKLSSVKPQPCEDSNANQHNSNALNALEGDVISRQAVLNTLDEMDKALDTDRTVESYKELLTECYKDLPSVKQEPKTGHWIDIDGGVECDKCGKWYPHALIAKNEIKFCSECGAKMVEPQESEDKE